MLAITGLGRVSQSWTLGLPPRVTTPDTRHTRHHKQHTTHDTIHCVSGQDLLTIAVLVMCAAHVTGHSPCPFSAVHLLIHGNLKLDHW